LSAVATLLAPLGLVAGVVVVYAGDLGALDPVPCGLMDDPLLLAPKGVGKADGLTAFALRLNAAMHCKTWAGSLLSYRSTVRNRSCEGRFNGGISQARRKWEMFSICTNGMLDCLYLTPGETAMLTSL
jgi:hypothetical protein